MTDILLVEDDPVLGKVLKVGLELEKYQVTWVQNLKSAFEANKSSSFQLTILDLGLPDGNGLDFCINIRKQGSRMPVVILTAQGDEDSVVRGLQAGANDYVRKPFGNKELFARIQVALKEPLMREEQLRCGDLLILCDQRKVMINNKEIELNRREFDILLYLVQHAEKVVTREVLLQALDKDGQIYDRTIDSHVSHLRSRLKQVEVSSIKINSVYGVGYRLEKK